MPTLHLQTSLPPSDCLARLRVRTGQLVRILPMLCFVQQRSVFMTRKGSTFLLASKTGLQSLSPLVAVVVRPTSAGGSELELSSYYDPVTSIAGLVLPIGVVGGGLAYAVYRVMNESFVIYLRLPHIFVLFAFILLMLAWLMYKPPAWAETAEPEEEVVAFVRSALSAEDAA
jgi:hypothetical protein